MESIGKLINCFRRLPGVGGKTAQRYAYSVIDMSEEEVAQFAAALVETKQTVKYCSVCGNFAESDLCDICKARDKSLVCVVAQPKDVLSMEKVREYKGVYHVLHGTISPMEGRTPDDIHIKQLLKRVTDGGVKEIIMATNPDVEGEATACYIARLLKNFGVKVTRLAQGVAIGSDLEYADEVTLSKALQNRSDM